MHPRLCIVEDEDWVDWIHSTGFVDWYMKLASKLGRRAEELAAPWGRHRYYMGESTLYIKRGVYDEAKRIDGRERELIFHEWLHHLYYLYKNDVDPAELFERYSHPPKAIPALAHALRNKFPANAFTRFLRLRKSHHQERRMFRAWFVSIEPERVWLDR